MGKYSNIRISSLSLLCILLLAGCMTYNSATDRNEFIFISTSQEVAMGKQAHQQLSKQYKMVTGTPDAVRLDHIGQTVARVSDRQDFVYHFNLVESKELNAFTLPGGYVYFFTGLYQQLHTDDQIAAVLAHEIGHCGAKHVVKRFQAALGYNWIGGMVDQVLSLQFPSIEPLAARGANAIAELAMKSYSRHDEYEADRLGIKYLYLSGYDLNAMIQVFDILQRNTKGDHVPLILRTHPFFKNRIEAVKREMMLVKQKY